LGGEVRGELENYGATFRKSPNGERGLARLRQSSPQQRRVRKKNRRPTPAKGDMGGGKASSFRTLCQRSRLNERKAGERKWKERRKRT